MVVRVPLPPPAPRTIALAVVQPVGVVQVLNTPLPPGVEYVVRIQRKSEQGQLQGKGSKDRHSVRPQDH